MVLSGFESSPTSPIPHDAKALVAPDDEELPRSGPCSNPSHRMVMGLNKSQPTLRKLFRKVLGSRSLKLALPLHPVPPVKCRRCHDGRVIPHSVLVLMLAQ